MLLFITATWICINFRFTWSLIRQVLRLVSVIATNWNQINNLKTQHRSNMTTGSHGNHRTPNAEQHLLKMFALNRHLKIDQVCDYKCLQKLKFSETCSQFSNKLIIHSSKYCELSDRICQLNILRCTWDLLHENKKMGVVFDLRHLIYDVG